MKRYYTVKEASRLLGVSTNTVYKYLNEGKLSSKRIGKGRFKILYSSIAPFIDINKKDQFNQSVEKKVTSSSAVGVTKNTDDIVTPEIVKVEPGRNSKGLFKKRGFYYLYAMVWVLGIFMFGAFAIKSTNNRIISKSNVVMQEDINIITTSINNKFEMCCSSMTSVAGEEITVNAVENEDAEQSTEIARGLYKELGNVQRVVVFDEVGRRLGSYPLVSSEQESDYSSTEYFKQTKSTYKSYVSKLIELDSGSLGIVHTEPIFKDNDFIGMLGVYLSLDGLSPIFNQVKSEGKYEINVLDSAGTYVYSTNGTKTGTGVSEQELTRMKSNANNDDLYQAQTSAALGWLIFYRIDEGYIASEASNFNAYIFLVLLVNMIMSFVVARVLASRDAQSSNEVDVPDLQSLPSSHGIGTSPV